MNIPYYGRTKDTPSTVLHMEFLLCCNCTRMMSDVAEDELSIAHHCHDCGIRSRAYYTDDGDIRHQMWKGEEILVDRLFEKKYFEEIV